MPTVVRRSSVNLFEARREILHAVSWQVQSSIWSPPTDVYETDDAYAVRVEIAGMREDDFEVVVENNTPQVRYHGLISDKSAPFGVFVVTGSGP